MHFQWASMSSESSDIVREQALTRGFSETATQVGEPRHDHYLEQRSWSMQTVFAFSLRQGCTSDHKTRLNHWWKQTSQRTMSILPGGQLTLLEPLGDLARGQPSPIEPGGLAGEVLLFIKS